MCRLCTDRTGVDCQRDPTRRTQTVSQGCSALFLFGLFFFLQIKLASVSPASTTCLMPFIFVQCIVGQQCPSKADLKQNLLWVFFFPQQSVLLHEKFTSGFYCRALCCFRVKLGGELWNTLRASI